MNKINPKLYSQMTDMIHKCINMDPYNALDVACGAGQVSENVLEGKFIRVDMFDCNKKAI